MNLYRREAMEWVIMMKIGVLTDLHSNLPALEAVLQHFEENGCSEIFCCGDIIGIGPWPEETVQRVMKLQSFYAVQGNHDGYLTNGLRFPWPDGMGDGEAAHHYWEHGLLSAASKAFLKSLPTSLLLEREGVQISLSHYPLTKDGNYAAFCRDPNQEDCRALCGEMPQADLYLYGHDHKPSLVRGDSLYLNFGSLGCPHNGKGEAHCGILTLKNGKINFAAVSLPYDLGKVIRKIDSLQYSDYQLIKKVFYGV